MAAAKKKLILPERLYPFEDLIDQDAQGLVELISPQALAVPTSQVPLVSIIIPIYNQALYTFNCLRAIASNTDGIDYEVIVIDDCSTDQTATMLSQIRGIRVERHHHNQGFIASCNRGASLAQGQYLCFLNNDTQVLPGWLGRLVQTFRAYPQAGAVGAKLLYGDRTLQEAGGMVWQDGRATNFGKYGDHHQPAYNYVRSVDYCSAACLLVRQDLFNQAGGFDPHFAPAYYEDTDLCFQLRARGYQVLYQPRAVVIHYEGISHGVQLNLGLKQAQTQNQFKFWQKWRHQLQFHHLASSGLGTSKITICLVASGSSPQLSAIAQLLLRLGYHLICWIEQLDFNLGQTLQQQGVELLYPTHLASGFAAQIRQVHQIYCLDQAIATKYRAIFLTLGNQVKIISGASRKNQAGLAASEIPDRITTNPLAKFLTFFDE